MKDTYEAHLYNPRPNALENGPPKRINRMEDHIGEIVPGSKKRVTWQFTLGDADFTHAVVLTHSVMSYKKTIEFDGYQVHHSAVATMNDWRCILYYDNTQHVMEVRINDVVSEEVPKYDLIVNRVPYRKWDVYRRRKFSAPSLPHAAIGSVASGGNSQGYGKHQWGPGGLSGPASEPVRMHKEAMPSKESHSEIFSNFAFINSAEAGATGDNLTKMNEMKKRSATRLDQQSQPKPIINLIDENIEESSMTTQSLLFDPLSQHAAPSRIEEPRKTEKPTNAPYVDPFATPYQPPLLNYNTANVNLDPLAPQSAYHPTYITPRISVQPAPLSQSAQTVKTPATSSADSLSQSQPSGTDNVNYNISQLLNPINVSGANSLHANKNIDIDPFAGLK